MKMEIKVDVHAVHPAKAPVDATRAIGPKPYGSWCTTDGSPKHIEITKTNSNIERNSQIEDVKDQSFEQQKVRLFASSPPPAYKAHTKDPITELKELTKTDSCDSEIKRLSISNEEEPPVETPQSPVPTSPVKGKGYKGLQVPVWCDPFLPIDPQGRYYITWLWLVTLCYSYNAWCIPLRAAFPYQTPQNTPIWMVIDYMCDLVYLLDVTLVKPKLMFLQEGFWVDDRTETKKNYMRKSQYKYDVIALLPLDLLYIFLGTQWVILRSPRLLKLQTFWEFHQAMDRVLSSPYVVRIGKTLFYIFYLIHLNACAYYATSDYIGLGSNGWVYDNQGNAYLRCFYFATKTATSIGKNPKPEKLEEYLFMTAAWLLGVFVFALLIGQIRDIIATATRARSDYRKRVDSCTEYLRRLNMPSSLQTRVTSWYNYTWSQQRCFDESKLLNALPYNMKRDVALAVHMSTLSKVQLFLDCSDSLLRDLVLQLKPMNFLPGDVVVRRGDVGHQMYIIKSGVCCVMSQDETEVLATLKEGSVFGEISLLGIDGLRRRTATVRSRGYSSLFALSRYDLETALTHHKEAARILRLKADQIIRENAARQAKQRLMEQEAKRAAETSSAGKRRRSSASSESRSAGRHRARSASNQSKRRLSAVSEDVVMKDPVSRPSVASAASGFRTPVPTIVFSSDSS